jgi:hypothetical protein
MAARMPAPPSIAAASFRYLLVALPVSCGGAEFVLAPDGAADLTGRDSFANASDGSTDAPSATATYCQSLSEYYSRCHFTGDCYRTNLMNCERFALSDAVRSAFLECKSNIQCTQASDALRQSCVSSRLAILALTPAQIQLASDYCSACTLPGTVCNPMTFFKEGITSTGDGPGFAALLYSDAIATSIDKQCLSTGAVGCASFGICEALIQAQLPGDACKDGG